MAQTVTRPGPPPIRKRPKQLPFPLNLYQSAVGRKWVMAVTGIVLLGFVVTHMIGNLHLYEGPLEIREYAETLRDLGVHVIPRTWLLWAIRLVLILAFVLHVHSAYSLAAMSAKASPRTGVFGEKDYHREQEYIAANYASRTMRFTGPIVLAYLFFHLADLTWGWFWGDDWVRGDPYNNVVVSITHWWVAAIYIFANVMLAIHIFHGTWSLFQSLGINSPKFNDARRYVALGLAGLILVGNLSFPIAVRAGLIDQDGCLPPCGITAEHEAEAEAEG